MKQEIKCQAESIVPQITLAASVVGQKNTLPILSSLRLETKNWEQGGTYFEITSSDGDSWLQIKANGIEAEEGVNFCINAKDFLQALRNLGNKALAMEIDTDTNTLLCSYGKGRFSLPIEETTNYPMPTRDTNGETVECAVVADRFLAAIERSGFATANDSLRPIMNGIHFDFNAEGMTAVSTNGYMLAKYVDSIVKIANINGDETQGFTMPKKPSTILMNTLGSQNGDVKVSFDTHTAVFSNDTFKFTTRLQEGRYPNYNAVIPTNNNIEVSVNKDELVAALKRVQPMSNTSSNLVVMHFENNEMKVSTEDFDFSKKAAEEIDCEYAFTNPPFTIGFKGSALLQILGSIEGEMVKFTLCDPSRAGLIYEGTPNNKGYEYLALVMPMRVNN